MVSEYTGLGKVSFISDESILEPAPDCIHHIENRRRILENSTRLIRAVKVEAIDDSIILKNGIMRDRIKAREFAKVLAHVQDN